MAPSTERLKATLHLAYGSTLGDEKVLVSKQEAVSTVGFQHVIIPLELAISATDAQVNLSSYVDTATFIAIEDRNNTGVLVGRTAGTAARLNVAANGWLCFKNGASTPPTLFFDNPDGANKAFINIYILGSST
jgi:hypothetical protein